MADATQAYPVSLSIDYPERKLNRLTSFFRIFVAIPILVIIILLAGGPQAGWDMSDKGYQYGGAAAFVFLPLVLMLLFRQKYPRWWYDWNLALTRFTMRVDAYVLLLTDVYPSTDEEQAVHLEIPYPEAKNLNRWLPLVKWLLAIPHYIVLAFLSIGVVIIVVVAWFAILFSGRFPKGLFDYVVGVYRWCLRVSAYAFLLTTDRYPPFDLS